MYSELSGKEIDYEDEKGTRKAIIVAVEEDIGITIVDKNDKNHHLLCLRCKNAPNYIKSKNLDPEKTFEVLVNQIKEGKVNGVEAEMIYRKGKMYYGGNLSADYCAFAQ